MIPELLFIGCGLFGAFCIGIISAFYAQKKQREGHQQELRQIHQQLLESREELDKARGRITELRERIAAGVDPEIYLALRDRYNLLDDRHTELERKVALGLTGALKDELDSVRFLEDIGVSITGEVPPEEQDDLTQIRGISPYLAERLTKIGIRTLEQISRLDEDQIHLVNDALEILPGRIRREDWVGQSQKLIKVSKRH